MSTLREDFNRALDWDDEIENESEFTLLPEGVYDFEVIKFERGNHNGSDKLPPCKKAILTIKVYGNNGESTVINHNLFLHTKMEGLLSAFFLSIGEKKHGEKVRMNWQNVIGAKGKCKVYVDTYNGNQYNKIKSFIAPENNNSVSSSKYGGF
ncbi:MAG: DUF669 domain-containing protein [Clostridia bacterium]|nr:DUF669 domain-containing protein [Clostridia bacterium]